MRRPKGITGNRSFLLVAALAVAAALFVRVRHDRHVGATTSFADLQRRAQAHPDNAQAQLDWGDALRGLHRDAEAEAAFKIAANLAPTDPRPLDRLGILAAEQKRPVEALGYFHASLKLNPRDADIWRD